MALKGGQAPKRAVSKHNAKVLGTDQGVDRTAQRVGRSFGSDGSGRTVTRPVAK